MSQVKVPREFKFVGGPSRKRRRRNGPKPPPRKPTFRASVEATEPVQIATAPATACAPDIPAEPPVQNSMLNCNLMDDSLPVPGLLSPSAEDGQPRLSESLDWMNSSSMNPFIDPGLSFSGPYDLTNTSLQIPFYFGPDVPFVPFEDSPTSDSSNHEVNHEVNSDIPSPAVEEMSDKDSSKSESVFDEMEAIAQQSLSLPHAPGNIGDTISQLLTRYDQEFCVMPLTHDFEANPFRFNAETGHGSQLLLHCILALSYKHIHRDTGSCLTEAKMHKKKALRLLRSMEDDSQDNGIVKNASLEANFLDAVLILMTLDCATSAHGPWVWYLNRALRMIQATESYHVNSTPRMQARIEMLVWWDVTLALTSRRGCVLSEKTAMSLFNPHGSDAQTFYSVSGCPEELFKYMIRLGAYAREFELAATMTCVKFDMEPVLLVERSIRQWKDPEQYSEEAESLTGSPITNGQDAQDPGAMAHYREDLWHCSEAWRYGLLIYIERVFKWKRQGPVSSILGFLARKTLNHVSSCRKTNMFQKQLLLPVFLAGCETNDEALREDVRAYCTWWNEKTRYDMFLTATAILEQVWAAQDPHSWWGSIIDQTTRSNSSGRGARQYLFG